MSIHVLDTLHLGRPNIVAATALVTDDGIALFDVGAEATFENVVAALKKLGATPSDVRHVFLSHIHLDHAGAAWRLAEAGATIYVHPRGAPHLLDPTRVVDSATRIFGEKMRTLWGEIRPTAPANLRVLEDGEIVPVAALRIRAHATPGHASHHHVYHWEDNLFGGDVAGVRIGHGPPVPPFVPPELEIEAWLDSIARMRGLEARRLYLPHFGQIQASLEEHFDQLERRVRAWAGWFRDRLREESDDDDLRTKFAEKLALELAEAGASSAENDDYEAADPSFMAISAAARYWKKFHPDEILPKKN